MLTPDTRIFIQFPEEQQPQVLHAAEVESADGHRLIVAAEESFLPVEVGLAIDVFYEDRRRFQRIGATIVSTRVGPRPRFAIETSGTPLPAEHRKCYRVSNSMVELTCTFHGREHCSIEDVSVTGFAVISPDALSIGDTVDAVVCDLRDRAFAGRVTVRSMRRLGERFRYGVEVAAPESSGANLQRVVSALSQSLQRRELRRLTATA